MSVLLYRRPSYVERPSGPLNKSDCQRYVERTKGGKSTIPDNLSFDNVINGSSLPPCTLSDFMDYMVYVAHDAENLQFYLWLRDYTARFNALRSEERALSPEWQVKDDPLAAANDKDRKTTRKSAESGNLLSELASSGAVADKRCSTPGPEALNAVAASMGFENPPAAKDATTSDFESFIARSVNSQKTATQITEDVNTAVGLKWQGFSIQPFRNEVTKVITHYIAPGSPRELNLSHKDRTAVLHALQHTTHPSAFTVIDDLITVTLRGQSHPNFIRWSICNGNKPKIFFVKTMGISHSILGPLIALILTLSHVSRWWRILPAIITWIGLFTLIAAYKGLCIVLHGTGKTRNLRPWEETDSELEEQQSWRHSDEQHTLSDSVRFEKGFTTPNSSDEKPGSKGSSQAKRFSPSALNPFGNSNKGYEIEPWYAKYQKRNMVSKIFERSTWVQEDAVRMIQDRIILQSQIWALILTVIITVIFVAVPAGNFY